MSYGPLLDQFGTVLNQGDLVYRTAVDDGAPLWATSGQIVGLARTRIRVEWSGFSYEGRKPHVCHPSVVRLIPRTA